MTASAEVVAKPAASHERGCAAACRKGAALILLAISAVIFSTIGLLVSLLGPRYSSWQITSCRFYSQAVCVWIGLVATRTPIAVPRNKWLPMFLRGFCGSTAMMLFYFAITHMPLADANVLLFTNPVITLALGFFILHEKFSPLDGFAVMLSMVGVVLVVRPSFIFHEQEEERAHDSVGSGHVPVVVAGLSALLGAVFAACAFLSIRKMKELHMLVITNYFSIIGGTNATIFMLATTGFIAPQSLGDGVMLFVTGVMGFCGQMLLTKGFQLASNAGTAATIRQLDIVCAFLFQVFLEHEPVSAWSVAGAALIVVCVLLVAVKKCSGGTPTDSAGDDSADADVEAALDSSSDDETQLATARQRVKLAKSTPAQASEGVQLVVRGHDHEGGTQPGGGEGTRTSWASKIVASSKRALASRGQYAQLDRREDEEA